MSNIEDVTVQVHVRSSNPILPIIVVETAIKKGAGILTETILGGQVTIHVELTSGEEVRPLKSGEFVYVTGVQGTSPFALNTPLTVDSVRKPWKFSRVSGSSGP